MLPDDVIIGYGKSSELDHCLVVTKLKVHGRQN